jgi:hypothetical protein
MLTTSKYCGMAGMQTLPAWRASSIYPSNEPCRTAPGCNEADRSWLLVLFRIYPLYIDSYQRTTAMTLQYSGRSDVRSWDTAYTVLIGIILLAVLPFNFLFLIKNRYGRDPARRFVLWLQASFCLFCL